MIDEQTRHRFGQIQDRALKDGIPLVEVLKTNGLLRDDETVAADWDKCLDWLAMNISDQPVVAFTLLGGGQNTPMDAIRGVITFIEMFKTRKVVTR